MATSSPSTGAAATPSSAPAPAVQPLPFSEAEVQALHGDDRKAAAIIIGLMSGIFLIGITLYVIVSILAAAGPS